MCLFVSEVVVRDWTRPSEYRFIYTYFICISSFIAYGRHII
jgi:hypothetical protein